MILLMPLCFFLLILIIQQKLSLHDWRESVLHGSVIYGVYITIVTETLSLFHALTATWVLRVWLITAVLLFFTVLKSRPPLPLCHISRLKLRPNLAYHLSLSILFIVSVLGILSYVTPPNNSDSLVYHLSRIMHWQQNQSVAFYPTVILRQLHQPPWSEFAMLHVYFLGNNDYLFSFIQWSSMVGCLVVVSLLAAHFKATQLGQISAAFFAVTVPMGVLQSVSTQNDYVLSFWLTCFVYYGLTYKKTAKLMYLVGMAFSLGLALATKGTAYIYALPFLVWFYIPNRRPHHAIKYSGIFIALVLLLNMPHYIRNINLYNHPLGPGQEGQGNDYKYSNDIFTVSVMLSNIMRNTVLHLGSTPAINRHIEHGITWSHQYLGVSVNDPQTTWTHTKFKLNVPLPHHDLAGNSIHLMLFFIMIIMSMLSQRYYLSSEIKQFLIVLSIAFLLFCLLLKWQPWHSRLHLPLFILMTIPLGLMLQNMPKRIANVLTVLFLCYSLPYLCLNISKPIISLSQGENVFQRTYHESLLMPPYYLESVPFLKSMPCSEFGLILEESDPEYHFWALFQRYIKQDVRLEHVYVNNISQKLAPQINNPCAIITTNITQTTRLLSPQTPYRQVWSHEQLSILVR